LPPESRFPDAIRSYTVPIAGNLFPELFASVRFEDVGKGRLGAVLVRIDESGAVPLVRTTTRYSVPAQRFGAVHERLAQQIQERLTLAAGFNNALIECYTNAYKKMGSHSDQAVDLADGSFIAVFSCYEHPEVGPPRKLVVESKGCGGDLVEIPLTHNSVATFSVDANRRFKHKIVLDVATRMPENRWLGVTFRTSKTFVRFRGGRPFFSDGAHLVPADEEQRNEFYHLRRRENNETDFAYPPLTYTISESDLMPPL
jgi:hypothetical protein